MEAMKGGSQPYVELMGRRYVFLVSNGASLQFSLLPLVECA